MIKSLSLKLFFLFILVHFSSLSQDKITGSSLMTASPFQFEKTEFDIQVAASFNNPFDQKDITLDMVLSSPSGKSLKLPCYYVSGDETLSNWKARFAASESGTYTYHFELKKNGALANSSTDQSFNAAASAKNGFIHSNNNWSFKFDNGKAFRGLGENIGWEPTNANGIYTYDLLLPHISKYGANFFRSWMCNWNFPIEWKQVGGPKYTNSDEYFNPSGIKRMDEIIEMIDSLDLHMMLALGHHGELIPSDLWPKNNYNSANGGPAATPADFFTSTAAKEMYKNKLRYIVARWGYSTGIGVWEFFNEIDNAMYDGTNIIIPHSAVTNWHTEMSAYLKSIDPYEHLISTSISHREITGLYSVPDMDFNQVHIYKNTGGIPSKLKNNSTGKPLVIGEFAYEWDWNVNFQTIANELDYDYKRGLWYGLFSPTPILPMSWWWEFFHDRGLDTYFSGVKEISDQMLLAGNGDFNNIMATSPETTLEVYAAKAGEKYFIYVLNNSSSSISDKSISITVMNDNTFEIKSFDPELLTYEDLGNFTSNSKSLQISNISLEPKESKVYILSLQGDQQGFQAPYLPSPSSLPGKIEAEDFDLGGEGIAYHDFEMSNTKGEYRASEGVDIEICSEGGFNVTDAVKDEWIEYTVNIDTAGTYLLEARVASVTEGGKFKVEIDGENISGTIDVPNTGGLQSWQTQSVNTSLISAGKKTIRIVMESSSFNLNYLNFILVNKAPVVAIISPTQDTTFTAPATINIVASANDEDGSVAKVEFYNGSSLLGESTASPYSFSWTPLPGSYNLTAKATDDQGLTLTSAPLKVMVNPSQTQNPFGGTAAAIPGKIEAENYDEGAEGIAYHDLSVGNKFTKYRENDVDIEECTDQNGGFSLGDLQAGEWTEYTVTVAENGNYDLEFRVATQMDNTKFHLEMNGIDFTGSILVPNTGGWQTWTSVKKQNVSLTAGQKVMRLVIEGEFFNLNFINFTPSVTTGIEDEITSSLKIFPNPAKNQLLIDDNYEFAHEIKVFDAQGKMVGNYSGKSKSINIENLKPGIYEVMIYNQEGNRFKGFRIIKE